MGPLQNLRYFIRLFDCYVFATFVCLYHSFPVQFFFLNFPSSLSLDSNPVSNKLCCLFLIYISFVCFWLHLFVFICLFFFLAFFAFISCSFSLIFLTSLPLGSNPISSKLSQLLIFAGSRMIKCFQNICTLQGGGIFGWNFQRKCQFESP